MTAALPPTAWTTGTTEVFKTGTWRSMLPRHVARPSPCHQACPVNGEIATWIGHARAGDLRRAWEVLTVNNPFPAIAGRVCHHPCEAACNRAAYDEAVSVCRLERSVGDAALARGWAFDVPALEAPGHVAVVGGGPSGLSAAYQLRRRGWRVSLHEAAPKLGGLMRYGIPAYRLPRDVLDAEIGRIVAMGVEVHCNSPLEDAAALDRLIATHDAVYAATGAARPKTLPQFPPRAPWLLQASDYLARSSEGVRAPLGRRVIVVGGGSAAMDVARTARRGGSEVAVVALEPRDRMPAQADEVHEALEEGVTFHHGAMVCSSRALPGGGVAVDCVHVAFEAAVPGGPPRVKPLPGNEFSLSADAVIVAIGQDAELSPFTSCGTTGAVLQVDIGQSTSRDKLWAGGDLASMARFVTEAVGMGKRAAIDIDRRLRGKTLEAASRNVPLEFAWNATRAAPVAIAEIATWHHTHGRRPAAVRAGAKQRLATGGEVQIALSAAELQGEAERCFSCGSCTACDNCYSYCPDLAVKRVDGGYTVLADYCKGCGVCVRECPTGSMLLQEETR
ncbi:FAD-dependent oxidoreductase [Ramlibacter albus]|uniref:FAD-dependent oxidoreductase n=1 Tax=Ramlibacter albus TaxID=2079448 RepID=A0A923MCF4_9BURK|nr:FAD-dependent oxidoreductase [Ramlibacter albus]MBC5768120.1 FAD-dependent oxidoreductase [Ramlibacter albus]